jgi:stage II sporulation protein D
MENMEPEIKVGILAAPEIKFKLNGRFKHLETGRIYNGPGAIVPGDGGAVFLVDGQPIQATLPIELQPVDYQDSDFELFGVIIGIQFHWERQENQRFRGSLRIMEETGQLTAINILKLEDYLLSVISSEMSATSSGELLKAHAVISRSWLLAQMEKSHRLVEKGTYVACLETDQERVKWYDREDHAHFDVCADDHCQRYQGITKASTPAVRMAVAETQGLILAYNQEICDARFSKCCGGTTELFENAWEPIHHPYLLNVTDGPNDPAGYQMDLTVEDHAQKWIRTAPEAWCNTNDRNILTQVLNDYDQETPDFYRWKKVYSQGELQNLLKTKVGIDVGQVVDLIPLQRGESARLVRLMISGTQSSRIIGKELEIRKALSESHLYSSAFVVDKSDLVHGIPQTFTLHGAGWGHGVGLCQIGAAMMGSRGFDFREILGHYFRGTNLEKRY